MPAALISGVPFRLYAAVASAAPQAAFAVQNSDTGTDFSVLFVAQGTVTSLTATLECSMDGGTTWVTYKAAANFFNAVSAATSVLVTIVAGVLYRINPSVVTGSIDFWACAN